MNGQLEPADYSEMKKRLDIQISETKSKLTELKADKESSLERMNQKLKILTNLMEWYRNQGVREKMKLLGSIFPQKFILMAFKFEPEKSTIRLRYLSIIPDVSTQSKRSRGI